MNQKVINIGYLIAITMLLAVGLYCYQGLQTCHSTKPIAVVSPSPTISFFDHVMNCQRETAHKDANE